MRKLQTKLHYIATTLKPFQLLIHALLIIGLSVFFWLVTLNNINYEHYLFGSALVIIWALLINLVIFGFAKLPSQSDKNTGIIAKLRFKLFSVYLLLLTVIFIIALLATLFISYRLLNLGLL